MVYLHELAHYLRRAKCITIRDASNRKSQEDGEEEGGYGLEIKLFGEIAKYITDEAGGFLLSDNLAEIIGEYRKDLMDKTDSQINNKWHS